MHSSPMFCIAKHRGGVRKPEGLENIIFQSYMFLNLQLVYFLDGLCGRYIQPVFYLKCVFPSLILITVVHFDAEGHMGI